MKVLLYGSGNRCRILIEFLKNSEYKIYGIVDSNPEKWGKYICDILISSPDLLRIQDDIYVCVTFYSSLVNEPIWDELYNKYGVSYERQITFYDLLVNIYINKYKNNDFTLNEKKWTVFLDGSWSLDLGGVESWIKDTFMYFNNDSMSDIKLLTDKNKVKFDIRKKNNIVDLSFNDNMDYSNYAVNKCLIFIIGNLPCTLIFSRVDVLLIAACIIKSKYPNKIKIISTIHGSCDGTIRDTLSFRQYIDKYVCVSQGIRNIILSKGIIECKVYNMTVPIKFKIPQKSNHKNDKLINIGYAGRLEIFEKRMDILIKLISELESRSIRYNINIAGNGNCYNMIKDFIQTNNLGNHVFLLGYIPRERMSVFWAEQDIAINVSDNEGRPISNMEAMLYGAVPVVTETIGILDDVKNGENGFVVPINDYKEMANKIVYLSENRDVLRRMSKKAITEIKSKMSVEKYILLWKSILYDL